jgi:putative transposase
MRPLPGVEEKGKVWYAIARRVCEGFGTGIAEEIEMSSTFLSLHYHLVFGTKNRQALIAPEWKDDLHGYMGGTIAGLGGVAECVGGVGDHVHLLVRLRATHTLADVLRELKKASSVWVHDEVGLADFEWQNGYGAFTVGATGCLRVANYIKNQEAHHRTKSFREEFIEMLERAGVDFDPHFLD